jgi:hypothetical protein
VSNDFHALAEVDIPEFFGAVRFALKTWTDEELDEQISLGNDQYTVMVDGSVRPSRTDFALVQKTIRIDFLRSAVDLAIAEMKRLFATEIRNFVVSTGAPRVTLRGIPSLRLDSNVGSELVTNIRVWHGSKDGGVTEVTNSSEIKQFQVGDYVMMTPATNLVWLANSPLLRFKDSSRKGFLGKAAASIRRKMRITKSSSSISVQAGFSRQIASVMGLTVENSGRNALLYGQPVLYIRVRTPKAYFSGR